MMIIHNVETSGMQAAPLPRLVTGSLGERLRVIPAVVVTPDRLRTASLAFMTILRLW
jgi:hypothetical protein